MRYFIDMALHMIKLVVGIDDLDAFYNWQQHDVADFQGQPANTVWTRYKPKRADEMLSSGGSIYRVIKNKICCRQKLLGFEMVETKEKGTQCLIYTETDLIQTYSTPKRPFQGWRYFEQAAVPKDRGLYLGENQREEIEPELENELRESGLL